MTNKTKVLFISWSPRKWNTNYILSKIYNSISLNQKEFISLKDYNINFCKGCLSCHKTNKCIISDDMKSVLQKMQESDIFIIWTPNYFDNVSWLIKNFIDRTHPFYKAETIANKKVIFIYVWWWEKKWTKKFLDLSFYWFVKYLKLKLVDSYTFQALDSNDIEHIDISKDISKIVKQIEGL